MDILETMKERCSKEGYTFTKNIEKIAKAKNMMFGETDWQRCPCDGSNEQRFCISDQCRQDIEDKGVCHCNCYQKADL